LEQLQFNLYDACREEFVIPDKVLNLGTSNASVKRIRKMDIVNKFLNEHHYLHAGDKEKSIAVITRAYGLYLGGSLASLVVYNAPGSSSIPEYIFGKDTEEAPLRQGTLAMSRLVTCPDAPFNSTGYLISRSLKMIWEDNIERKKDFKPIYRCICTFADTLFHTGTVYRAQNAWFSGISYGSSLGGFYNEETGDIRNVRQGKRTLTLKDCPPGWKPFRASDKLRYLFFLGNKGEQLQTMRQLNNEVKLQCKIDNFSVLKEGRIVKPTEHRSYENVYHLTSNRGTNRVGRYIDYLQGKSV